MLTRINQVICDWTLVKNHCRTTDNKDFTAKEPTDEFKRRLLYSEHSPIRLIEVDWTWEDIPSWVATHWSRHKWECFISTQRDDRKEHTISRAEMPQGVPVKFDGHANMQSLIDTFRKRLCYKASPETRMYAEDFKMALGKEYPQLAFMLVPNCVYRCGCPEFSSCGFFRKFWENNQALLRSLDARYILYNSQFYVKHPFEESEVK